MNDWLDRLTAFIEGQLKLWAGLTVAVCAALLASSDLLPDGAWRHSIGIAGIVATAVYGYLLQRPKD